jgi:hypothetical protein
MQTDRSSTISFSRAAKWNGNGVAEGNKCVKESVRQTDSMIRVVRPANPIYVMLTKYSSRRYSMSTLNGKKAVVLGGSRGIGAAIVERLAAEGAASRPVISPPP